MIQFTDRQDKYLKQKSKGLQISKSELVRRILDIYVENTGGF